MEHYVGEGSHRVWLGVRKEGINRDPQITSMADIADVRHALTCALYLSSK